MAIIEAEYSDGTIYRFEVQNAIQMLNDEFWTHVYTKASQKHPTKFLTRLEAIAY